MRWTRKQPKMSAMTPDEWQSTIGVAIAARRVERGWNVTEAANVRGLSVPWWRTMEKGTVYEKGKAPRTPNPGAPKIKLMGDRLGWRADWLDRLKRGEDPVVVSASDASQPPDVYAMRREIDELRAQLGEIDNLRAQLSEVGELREKVAQYEEVVRLLRELGDGPK